MTDPDEFKRCLYGVDPNCGCGFDLTVIKAVIFQRDSFIIPYPFEFHCLPVDEVPQAFGDVSKYGYYLSES